MNITTQNQSAELELKFIESPYTETLEKIKTYLEKGVNINASNERGHTVLHKSVFYRREDVAAYLIENGADIFLKDINDKDAFDWAIERGNQKMIKLLKSAIEKKEAIAKTKKEIAR